MRKTLLVSLLFGALATTAQAQAPSFIPVQGVLTDANGDAVNDIFAVTFTLYADDTGTTQLWTEQTSVNFVNGAFTAYLGSTDDLDLALFRDNTDIYLGVQIGDDDEMALMTLASSPYAGFAQYAGFASDITDAAKVQIVGDVAVQLDNDGKVHDKYTDAEAQAVADAQLATHTAVADAHHAKYTDAEAVAALASHTSDVAAHHAKYTDAEAVAAVSATGAYVLNTGDTMTGNLIVDAASDQLNLGINTNNPQAALHVANTDTLTPFLRAGWLTVDSAQGEGLVNLLGGAKMADDGSGGDQHQYLGTRGASRILLGDGSIQLYAGDQPISGTQSANDPVNFILASTLGNTRVRCCAD